MARVFTEEDNLKKREALAKAAEARQADFDNRFVCGAWCVYKGDDLNHYLQPAKNEREDSSDRRFYNTFELALEHGMLPRLSADRDKRDVERILAGYADLRRDVLAALAAREQR